eukprot:gene7025-6671_t
MPDTAQLKKTLESATTKAFYGHKRKVGGISWNMDGSRLASGSMDNTARVWDVGADYSLGSTGRPATQSLVLSGHTGRIDGVRWAPNSTCVLATASCDKSVKLWDTRKAQPCVSTVELKGDNINLAWCPTGNYMAVGDKDDMISIIDAREMKVVKHHKFTQEVNEIGWDTLGRHLYVTGEGMVDLYSVPDLRLEHKVRAHPHKLLCLDFERNG